MTNSLGAPLRYSIAQAAQLLQLSRSTLYARIQEGQVSIHKDGRRSFILAEELERYLKAQTGGGRAGALAPGPHP